jgi:hypothetical protein
MSILGHNMTHCNTLCGAEITVTLQVRCREWLIHLSVFIIVSEHLSDEVFARELSDNVCSAEPQISKTAAVE